MTSQDVFEDRSRCRRRK